MSNYTVKKSKIGRPSVDSEAITLRLRKEAIERIDNWRRLELDIPGRPEAIRRLVDIALKSPRGGG
jgi:hypothetical protein